MIFKGHKDRYPYVSRETWITRCWLLVRKVIQQGGTPTVNDERVARILLHHSRAKRVNAPSHLIHMVEEVIINGPSSPWACPHCAAATEEGVGEE